MSQWAICELHDGNTRQFAFVVPISLKWDWYMSRQWFERCVVHDAVKVYVVEPISMDPGILQYIETIFSPIQFCLGLAEKYKGPPASHI